MDFKKLTIKKANELLKKGEVSVSELVKCSIKRVNETEEKIRSFVTILEEEFLLKKASEMDKKNPKEKARENLLFGIPYSAKDIFCTEGIRTTASSKILENFIPPYESTVTRKLLEKETVLIGKTNLDQFAHGSSTETSFIGPSRNPWDQERIPGGSSGGSATSVSSGQVIFSVGTETAGSIRQPSALCGIVGMKPTYGRVSRFGVIAMGSSLDCPGPMTKNVEDSAIVLSAIAGKDDLDSTTSMEKVPNYFRNLNLKSVQGKKIGVPKLFMNEKIDNVVREKVWEAIKILEKLGAKISEIDLIDPEIAVAVYTVVCRGEVSSNLARFDGVKYGLSEKNSSSIIELMQNSREKGFGLEAKRRIMTGTMVLSSEYSERYYKTAQKVRSLFLKNFEQVFEECDLVVGPTTPDVAIPIGSALENPLFGELSDILIVSSSISGLPGISVPVGLKNNLPIGFQIFGPQFSEQLILDVAYSLDLEFGGFENFSPEV